MRKTGKYPSRFVIEGEKMNGFFLVDKPKNCTSAAVVNQIKKKFNLKKCGHNGTLDPNTTGLLIVACDEATKLMKYLVTHDKVYETTIQFGYQTDTLDSTGHIEEEIEMNFTLEMLKHAIDRIKNRTKQLPPIYSAIKVSGKKLYEYARSGQNLKVEERDVQLYEVNILSDLRRIDSHLEIDLRLWCSKGFYVRSFARDLGLELGGCAIMKELRRIKSGSFSVKDSFPLEQLKEESLISIPQMFSDFDYLEVNSYIAHLATNGVLFDERQIKTEKPFYVVYNHAIIALYEAYAPFQYRPVLIFKEPLVLKTI